MMRIPHVLRASFFATLLPLFNAAPVHAQACNCGAGEEKSAAEKVTVNVEGSPQRGDPHAPVTVVMFADFECPYCQRGARRLAEVEEKYGTNVRVVFKHSPLPMHAHARWAARLGAAAAAQGTFWRFFDAMLEHSGTVDEVTIESAAKAAGVSLSAAQAQAYDAAVAVDLEQAKKLGVTGTPTFFINGRRLTGAQPLEEFSRVIDQELQHTNP